MHIQSSILTVILFLGYLFLWYTKRRELLHSDGVDVNVIGRSTSRFKSISGFSNELCQFQLF